MLDIPDEKTIRYDVLKYIHMAQPATRNDCINSLPHYDRNTVRNAVNDMTKGALILLERGLYRLSRQANDHFNFSAPTEKGPIVPPRVVNHMASKPLSGYEAAMRRNIRPDGVYQSAGYITSGTSLNLFCGGVRK